MTRLASLFTDHMVLQSGRSNPIWGWDRPGQAVTLRIEAARSMLDVVTAVTEADGAFRIACPALPVGGPYRLHVSGSRECTLDDVLSGEVWLASGQSNMEWKVSMSAHGAVEAAQARWPQIRVFGVAQRAAREPQTLVDGSWRPCSPETAGDFSAVGYYFAREIHRRLSVPVGVIDASWGGTRVEAWTSIEALRSVMDIDAERAHSENEPGALYHGMIAPLVPFGLRGVIWYQGESNVDNHPTYRDRFVALVRDWRAKWNGTGEVAFYFVQLAGFVDSLAWAYLREAQAEALAEPATGMAVTIDIGDPDDIHPRNKQDVGRRLALVALAGSYGQSGVEWSGPSVDRVEIGPGGVRVAFRHAAGLRARGGGEVRGFALAGDDRVCRAAQARIDGDAVIVTSPAVEVPVTVRYAWADNPDANLENAAGLPAAPFRTDRW